MFRACSPPVALEVLESLIHESPDCRLPAGLDAGIAGDIEVRHSLSVHERLGDRRGGHARHAGEGIDIHHAVITGRCIVQDSRDTEARLRADMEGEDIILSEDILQVGHFVAFFQVNDRLDLSVSLSLPELLIEKVPDKIAYFSKGSSHGIQAELLEGQAELSFRRSQPVVAHVVDPFRVGGIHDLGAISFQDAEHKVRESVDVR